MHPIVVTVEQLCGLVCQASPPSALELAARLGTVRRQSRSAVYVQPADPSFREAILGLDLRDGSLEHVELLLAGSAGLRVEALARYGQPQIPPRVSWDSPTSPRSPPG